MFAAGRPVKLADRPLFFNLERRLQRGVIFGEISPKPSGCNHTATNWRQLTGGIVALKIPLVASVYMSEKSEVQSLDDGSIKEQVG